MGASRCNCAGVLPGSYANQVMLTPPLPLRRNTPEGETATTVCVDACLADEVMALWKLGIRTTGCCCGHKVTSPFIGVVDDDIAAMKALGYVVQSNPHDAKRQDSFWPLGWGG